MYKARTLKKRNPCERRRFEGADRNFRAAKIIAAARDQYSRINEKFINNHKLLYFVISTKSLIYIISTTRDSLTSNFFIFQPCRAFLWGNFTTFCCIIFYRTLSSSGRRTVTILPTFYLSRLRTAQYAQLSWACVGRILYFLMITTS